MAPERYLSHIIASAFERQRNRGTDDLAHHIEAMASQVQPETTPEEMEAAMEELLRRSVRAESANREDRS
jgi:hypothetical protein